MFEIVYRYDPIQTSKPPRPMDADQARARLIQGNRQFVDLVKKSSDPDAVQQEVIDIDLSALGVSESSTAVPSQQPFAAVLSCSDARVPIELIFHQACNDLFVVRLAGNIISDECVGSIGYAVNHLSESVKVIVVLGHTNCGAVTAAVDAYLQPTRYPGITSEMGLRSIIDRVFVSVRVGARALEQTGFSRTSNEDLFRKRLIDLSVVLNSAMMALSLQQIVTANFPVVYGVYDLASRMVWAPHKDLDSLPWTEPRLSDPPSSLSEFESLSLLLARGSQA